MADYRLLTIWRIDAPLKEVYAAIEDSLRWPDWWPAVESVEQLAAGNASGIDNVRRYSWQGDLPYRVSFDMRTTRIRTQIAIEGSARGDLEGIGRWYFSQRGRSSIVSCEWRVRSTRLWMNLLTPLARRMFIRNHARVMAQGGEGLARRLGATLLAGKTLDLAATAVAPLPAASVRRRQGGRLDPTMALIVGCAAGVIATAVQLLLWWLTATPVMATLFRDARLTAALLLGPAALPPSSSTLPSATWGTWEILLAATVIHFALSVAYALPLSHFAGRLRHGPALLLGGLYGQVIYAINLHGATLLFPWFAVSRDWATLLTHLVFGVVLAGGFQLFSNWR